MTMPGSRPHCSQALALEIFRQWWNHTCCAKGGWLKLCPSGSFETSTCHWSTREIATCLERCECSRNSQPIWLHNSFRNCLPDRVAHSVIPKARSSTLTVLSWLKQNSDCSTFAKYISICLSGLNK